MKAATSRPAAFATRASSEDSSADRRRSSTIANVPVRQAARGRTPDLYTLAGAGVKAMRRAGHVPCGTLTSDEPDRTMNRARMPWRDFLKKAIRKPEAPNEPASQPPAGAAMPIAGRRPAAPDDPVARERRR